MLDNSKTFKRVSIITLVLCYLTLLGYHHLNQSSELNVEDVLVSEEFRGEIPREIADVVVAPKKVEPPKQPRYRFEKGALPTHAPKRLSRQESYFYYRELAAQYGLKVSGLTVIGLRGLAPNGARHDSGDNASMYDDTFVILDPAREVAVELLGSTHAGQPTSTLSPSGVAQIKPGPYYSYPCGDFAEMPCWLVTMPSGAETIPCWRDANGNGYIDPSEKTGNLLATEILFHNGRYQDYGSSIGCQVLPPHLMEQFIQEIGVENSFDYLLIDANQRL